MRRQSNLQPTQRFMPEAAEIVLLLIQFHFNLVVVPYQGFSLNTLCDVILRAVQLQADKCSNSSYTLAFTFERASPAQFGRAVKMLPVFV